MGPSRGEPQKSIKNQCEMATSKNERLSPGGPSWGRLVDDLAQNGSPGDIKTELSPGREHHFRKTVTGNRLHPAGHLRRPSWTTFLKMWPPGCQHGPQKGPQNRCKIDLDASWPFQASGSEVREPRISKIPSKWPPKLPKMNSRMTVLGIKSNSVQQSINQRLPADRGAGGRGEALRYIYIYIYIHIYKWGRFVDPWAQ